MKSTQELWKVPQDAWSNLPAEYLEEPVLLGEGALKLSLPKAFAQQCVFFKDELNCAVSLQAKLKVLHPLCREKLT